MPLARIEDAIAAIAEGKMVILVDDEDRENEGDLVLAADAVTPEALAFMMKHAHGLICLTLDGEQCDKLNLVPMASVNTAPLQTAFTRSIDWAGLDPSASISASARAETMKRAILDDAKSSDFVTPGSVFPLRARDGGVLVRSGQTEGSVDLARLAGRRPAGVICELMDKDGTMMRFSALEAFAEEHGLLIASVADLIRHRLENESLMTLASQATLPTQHGTFEIRVYENTIDKRLHVALLHGDISGDDAVMVRVHRADPLADVFGLGVNKARTSLEHALSRIAKEKAGVVVYLRPDGDRDPLSERLQYYSALVRGELKKKGSQAGQSMGFHSFGVGAQILAELGLKKIRVLTNTPRSFKGLSGHGIEIVDWVPLSGD